MKEITPRELQELKQSGEDFVLIDVREQHEYDIASIGGKLIPMAAVMQRLDEIPRDRKVIIHCKSGGRSGAIVQALESEHGYENLYNLKGGILAWSDQVDPSVPKY